MGNIISQIKIKYFLIILVMLLLAVYFSATALADSTDVVAVRILPNPQHYSAGRWYNSQGFAGSPQSLTVDGYEAVRDGRTVYVDAGNVDSTGSLFTNIYLISYNQTTEKETSDIFGQILSHWKFNTNLTVAGNCSISQSTSCLADADCPLKEYCTSLKANTIRDVRRWADLADIKVSLEKYKNTNGHYPILTSGSYIPDATISVWPSWQQTLASGLGVNLPVDPINRLGTCGDARFNPITCWDTGALQFAGAYTAPASSHDLPAVSLPADSYVYVYTVSADGSVYSLSMLSTTSGQSTAGSASFVNHAPQFLGAHLSGVSGQEFFGYVSATDPDNDQLQGSMDTSGTVWSSWSAAPTAIMIGKGSWRLHAKTAGQPGNYNLVFKVNDGRNEANSITTRTFTITVKDTPPQITANNLYYTVSSTAPFIYDARASSNSNVFPLTYQLVSPDISASTGYGLPAPTFNVNSGHTYYSFHLSGIFAPLAGGPGPAQRVYPVPSDGSKYIPFRLRVTDTYGASSTKDFNIYLQNNRPVVVSPNYCPLHIRRGSDYLGCQIKAVDQDGHAIIGYQAGNYPPGLSFNNTAGTLTGTVDFWDIADNNSGPVVHNFSAHATDEYGADSNAQSFPINVDSYCGDGIYQPAGNSEKRGGSKDNGYEECDAELPVGSGLTLYNANTNVARDACDSLNTISVNGTNVQKQYSCSTVSSTGSCSTSGSCTGTCTYTGGYCGNNQMDTVAGRGEFEDCDDGSGNSNLDNGYYAGSGLCWKRDPQNLTSRCCVPTYCGDGYAQNPNGSPTLPGNAEQCDDGASNAPSNRCLPGCQLNVCGDGYVYSSINSATNQPYEQCDLGATNSFTGHCLPNCIFNVCGDGHLDSSINSVTSQPYEQCEANGHGTGPNDQYTCTSCNWNGSGYCGDGIVQTGEECEGSNPRGCTNCKFVCPGGSDYVFYSSRYYCRKNAYTWTEQLDHTCNIHFFSSGAITYSHESMHGILSVPYGYPKTFTASNIFPNFAGTLYDINVFGAGSCLLNGSASVTTNEVVIPILEPSGGEHVCTAIIRQYNLP